MINMQLLLNTASVIKDQKSPDPTPPCPEVQANTFELVNG